MGNICALYFIYEPSSIFFINGKYAGRWTNSALKLNLITKNYENQNHRFVLSKTVEKKFSTPNRPCYEDINDFPLNRPIIDFIQSNNITYKQEYCFELCGELDYIETNPCNKTDISLENLNIIESNCIDRHTKYFKNQSLDQKFSKYCPLECDSTYYYAMISENSINPYPAVQIFFNEFKYTLITETGKTNKMDLVSNIGGLFDLFIGLSFVTLFEFIEIIIELFFIFYEKKNKVINAKSFEENLNEAVIYNDFLKRISQLEDEIIKFKLKNYCNCDNDVKKLNSKQNRMMTESSGLFNTLLDIYLALNNYIDNFNILMCDVYVDLSF
jgi:hypothetical protein